MSSVRIASRYAKSLLDLAIEQNKLERILDDVKTFQQAAEQRDFYLLLKSPIVKPSKKLDIFKALFADKFDTITNSFLNILVKKGRETFLPEIADAFMGQYKKLKKISTVKLTTAAPLTDSNKEAIKKKLQESEATEDTIDLHVQVDEELIGGFVIEFDDRLYDASVAHKLEELKKEFSDDQHKVKM